MSQTHDAWTQRCPECGSCSYRTYNYHFAVSEQSRKHSPILSPADSQDRMRECRRCEYHGRVGEWLDLTGPDSQTDSDTDGRVATASFWDIESTPTDSESRTDSTTDSHVETGSFWDIEFTPAASESQTDSDSDSDTDGDVETGSFWDIDE